MLNQKVNSRFRSWPASVTAALDRGHRVVVNVSRSVVEAACVRFPNVKVLHVTAGAAAIAARLGAREGAGREEQRDRLARRVDWQHGRAQVTEIRNEGPLAESLAAFLRAVTV